MMIFCVYEIGFRSRDAFRGHGYNQFIKYQIFNRAFYHKQRNLYLCLSPFSLFQHYAAFFIKFLFIVSGNLIVGDCVQYVINIE